MTKMLNLYDQTLHSTLNLVNLDEFGKIVQKMYDANVIALFPSIGNFFRAECFRQNMLEIGDYSLVIAPVVADLCTTPVALSAPPNSYQNNSQS